MTETLVSLGLSNLLLSAAIGLLAWLVHRRDRSPALAHLLWVLTLVAAVTPPLVVWSLPVLPSSMAADVVGAQVTTTPATGPAAVTATAIAAGLPSVLLAVWVAGSLIVFAASAQRIIRFGILLRRSCRPAPKGVQRMAALVAYELDMRTVPSIHVSAARLAPMTWWSGGRVRVVLPRALGSEVDDAQLRWILAHELAHIRRRDHLVRWLEWLASVAFWWNPVVWWARRNLRRDEEDACDALVLERLEGQPRAYARTLLTVVEVMAAKGGTPALATGLDAARSLEHRFTRIVSPAQTQRAPRAIAAASVLAALSLMSLGIGVGEAAPATGGVTTLPAVTVPAAPADRSTDGSGALAPAFAPYDRDALPDPVTAPVRADLAQRTVIGSAEAETIEGTAANETIKGLGGRDVIRGGPGKDSIDAGPGADVIRGGEGPDRLNGGRGGDRIGGGPGQDVINGGAGADVVQGGRGEDTISAGPGDDIVRVWADGTPDIVDCGGGSDRAIIDSTDTVSRCEDVIVRDPA